MTVPSRSFAARLANLPKVLHLVAHGCARAWLSVQTGHRAELVIEELFCNTVRHGYPVGTPGRVWIGLQHRGRCVVLRYEDAAPPYNPLIGASTMVHRRVHRQQVGGVGCLLVATLPRRAAYRRRHGRNALQLVFADR